MQPEFRKRRLLRTREWSVQRFKNAELLWSSQSNTWDIYECINICSRDQRQRNALIWTGGGEARSEGGGRGENRWIHSSSRISLALWYEQKRPFSPSWPYKGRLRQSASSQRLLTTSTMPSSLCAAQNLLVYYSSQSDRKKFQLLNKIILPEFADKMLLVERPRPVVLLVHTNGTLIPGTRTAVYRVVYERCCYVWNQSWLPICLQSQIKMIAMRVQVQ